MSIVWVWRLTDTGPSRQHATRDGNRTRCGRKIEAFPFKGKMDGRWHRVDRNTADAARICKRCERGLP